MEKSNTLKQQNNHSITLMHRAREGRICIRRAKALYVIWSCSLAVAFFKTPINKTCKEVDSNKSYQGSRLHERFRCRMQYRQENAC